MSPEHFLDLKRVDERTDIYALGKILYEAMAGKFDSELVPFRQASLPAPDSRFFQRLDEVIKSATAENREERFPSTHAFVEALESVRREENRSFFAPIASRTGRWFQLSLLPVGLLLLAITTSAAAGFIYVSRHDQRVLPILHDSNHVHRAVSNRTAKIDLHIPSDKKGGASVLEPHAAPPRRRTVPQKSAEPENTSRFRVARRAGRLWGRGIPNGFAGLFEQPPRTQRAGGNVRGGC